MLRIVSLAPSLTEDLFAIGVGPEVVGADTYSNYPQAAAEIPRVGALTGASVERITALKPTLVVGISYQSPILNQLKRYGIQTFASDDDSLDGLFATLTRLGTDTQHEQQAQHVINSMRHDIAMLTQRAKRLPERSSFAVISVAPIYTAGRQTFITTLLTLANLQTIVSPATPPWPQYSAEALAVAAPETIVTSSSEPLPQNPPWSDLPAMRNGCIFTLSADALLRPGPRFTTALRQLIHARELARSHC